MRGGNDEKQTRLKSLFEVQLHQEKYFSYPDRAERNMLQIQTARKSY